jgi:hypothetical protein
LLWTRKCPEALLDIPSLTTHSGDSGATDHSGATEGPP